MSFANLFNLDGKLHAVHAPDFSPFHVNVFRRPVAVKTQRAKVMHTI